MQNTEGYTERNIEKLLESSFNEKHRLTQQVKDDTIHILLQKVEQHKKISQPETKLIVALSAICIIIVLFLVFSEFRISLYVLDLIKLILGLSLVLVPVSSLVLIILNWRVHEKKMV